MAKANRYAQIIERIFLSKYREGSQEVEFEREEIVRVATELGIKLPKNLGDLLYSFRYRATLPEAIRSKAPEGFEWMIRPAGRSRYRFVVTKLASIIPSESLVQTKLPDATPGVVTMYSLNDEQALLARLRYNRLIDIFTGLTCYSLQNHLRTTVPLLGQIETDEIYIGLDRRGVHYVLPVQAKGGNDTLSIVQIEQDFALCAARFPNVVCRPIAAQFMRSNVIALFGFEETDNGILIEAERHFQLVAPTELTTDELLQYQARSL